MIHDKEKIQEALRQYHIDQYFQKTDLPFFLVTMEEDEDLNYQLNPEKYFLFFLQGQITIRHINEEGMYLQIAMINTFSMLGDMEFVHPGVRQYMITVEKKSLFLGLQLNEVRSVLMKDPVFLFSLARSIEEKIEKADPLLENQPNLKDKFLYYIQQTAGNKITSVNETCTRLHCSRRQLQRVLHDLCMEGTLIKSGKGSYYLPSSFAR